MRLKPFNSDKELKKVKCKYTKKQLITTLLVLVGMVTIGTSYAIFSIQPEYHTFVKSQVGEFSTGDISLAVLVDGTKQDNFPVKDTGYIFEEVTCSNGTTGTWDNENWNLQFIFTKPDKCTISFLQKNIIKSVSTSLDNLGNFNFDNIITNTNKEISSFNLKLYCKNQTYNFTEIGLYTVSACGGIGETYKYEISAVLENGETIEPQEFTGTIVSHSGGSSNIG